MRPKGMEDLAVFIAREVEGSSRGKRQVFLCRGTVRVKVIPAGFLKIQGRRTLVGAIEGQIEELVDGQNPGSEAPPRSKKGQEKRGQRRCQERSDGEG